MIESRLLVGDVREQLRTLPDASVHCVICSPPYWGLRDYGLPPQVWDGNPACGHEWKTERWYTEQSASSSSGEAFSEAGGANAARLKKARWRTADTCSRCSAWRGSLGLEPTPELYVQHLVAVFREVRRVLRDDGTLWLNLGDSYASSPPGNKATGLEKWATSGLHGGKISERYAATLDASVGRRPNTIAPGLKPKDLIGIPWLVAKALQSPYYAGRMKIEGDRRWMAAMIDGEGTICGFHHIRADDGRPRTGAHVFITNGNTDLLDEAQRIWPASRSEHMRPGDGHLGTIPTYRWIVHGIANKTVFLREMYPYLIAKKRQAVVAYNLLLLMADAKHLGHTAQRDATRKRRKFLTDMLSDLNQGRLVDLPSGLTEPPSCYEPGWYLRSDIVWAKPNPMPESVTDRPTKAHEYLFLMSKRATYFYDTEAVRERTGRESSLEEYADADGHRSPSGDLTEGVNAGFGSKKSSLTHPAGRSLRSVWWIATQPYPEAHFATFPEALVRPCILAGTSERGCCPTCGAPWERVAAAAEYEVTGTQDGPKRQAAASDHYVNRPYSERKLRLPHPDLGWRQTCDHGGEPVPATVLDPFAGSGTALLVAQKLGRNAIGVELNPAYSALAERRTEQSVLL